MNKEIRDITSPGELKITNSQRPGVLCTLEGPFGTSTEPTRNTRLYIRELWEKVINSKDVKEAMDTKTFFGEADHPLAYQQRLESHIPQISHNITELHLGADGIVYGKLDVLDTPNGRIVKTLVDYGSKLGISSRGTGEVIHSDRYESPIVNPDNYQFITFDLVVMPGAEVARLNKSQDIVESLKVELKQQITEAISVKDINSLESMKGLLEYVNDSELSTLKSQVDAVIEESVDTIDEEATTELLEAYGKISELENKLRESSEKEISLNNAINSMTHELEESRNTISKLNGELNEAYGKVAKYVEKCDDVTKSFNEYKKSQGNLIESLNQSREDTKRLIESNSKYETIIEDYKEVVSENKKSIEFMESVTKELDSEIKNLKSELLESKKSNSELKESMSQKIVSVLEEYVSIRCESVGLNPATVLNETSIRSDSTTEDIDDVIREHLSHNAKSRLRNSVSNMIINESTSFKCGISEQSSDEDSNYLSDIRNTVSYMKK